MYLAIDIGGTKTLLAVFSPQGKLLESSRFPTPREYGDFLKTLEENYQKLKHVTDMKQVVVGAPGKIDRSTGTVIAYGNLEWTNTPLKADIKKLFGVPTTVENDANLAGLSEAILISHQYKKVLYMTVSTGIGAILIINGKIEPEYADMEVGSMVFEHEGKIQQWEDFASGKALYEKYGRKASEIEEPSIWYEMSRNLALGLTNVVASLTPEVVVIGGGVGAHFDKFADRLHEEMLIYNSPLVSLPSLRQAVRAEDAVIYGCYELAKQLEA